MPGSDFTDLHHLARDLGTIRAGAATELRQAVEVTARRVKDDWNRNLYAAGHARRTRGSISYTVTVRADAIEAEIGPTIDRAQSGIVKLLETGSIHNRAHGYGAAALHANEDDLDTGIARALKDAGL